MQCGTPMGAARNQLGLIVMQSRQSDSPWVSAAESKRRSPFLSLLTWVLLSCSWLALSSGVKADDHTLDDSQNVAELIVDMLLEEGPEPEVVLNWLDNHWQASMVPMVVESVNFAESRHVRPRLLALLAKHTEQSFGSDLNAWYRWWWSQPEQKHPQYAQFKSLLYRNLDSKFEGYFSEQRETTVRLDEIRWGGVVQDGIPPLRYPDMITADQAGYLADSDVVFAVEYNGDARAYPKRILAWHEMFIDRIGGTEYAGVYCTLCGAVIMYDTEHKGVSHALGTSGFLYRSNKVMYDKETQSLWSTTFGRPVVGPLVGKGIRLQRSFLVTTTWGEWRRRHPDTTVLSLNTGHSRNYQEGAAYSDYFATDQLMFTVPKVDKRLANKAEIFALTFPELSEETLAISADFLLQNTVYHDVLGAQQFVVLTDPSGANRAYNAEGVRFVEFDGKEQVQDDTGAVWTLTEAELLRSDGKVMARLPAHRAFWFGWYAAHNDTRLVQ